MDKKYKYVLLEEGEIIQEGDEWLDIGDGIHLIWEKTLDVGKEVVSGIYRRRIEVETTPPTDRQGTYVVVAMNIFEYSENFDEAKERAEELCIERGYDMATVAVIVGQTRRVKRPVEWTWAGEA